jgi:hypothetical protein
MKLSNWSISSVLEWLIVAVTLFILIYSFIDFCLPQYESTLRQVIIAFSMTGLISLVMSYEIVKK